MTARDGGAAFPMLDHNGHSLVCREFGMSLRDYLTGQAVTGILAGYWGNPEMSGLGPQAIAEEAVAVADATLAALAARTEGGADNGL